jgi:hypothetical protein
MKSIWYFVGLTLTIMGVLVVLAGVIDFMSPPARTTVLGNMHPGLWWGAIMLIAGITFLIREPKQR